MDAQHTPGPWSYTDVRSQGSLVYHRIDAPGRLLGFAGTYRDGQKIVDDTQCEANARLIAAAPELLSEAEFLLARLEEAERDMADDDFAREYAGHVSPSVARLKAIVAKARGQ